MNGCHSCGIYLMFIVAIRSSTFLQALTSPFVLKKCWTSFWRERNAFTFTCHPEDCTVVDLKRSEISICVILCDWGEFTFSLNTEFLEVEGCSVSSVAFSSSSSQFGVKLSGSSEIARPSQRVTGRITMVYLGTLLPTLYFSYFLYE